MIRMATEADIDGIEGGYLEYLAHAEKTKQYTNWRKGLYPTRQFAADAVALETMYVLEEEGEILASMLLNHEQSAAYREIAWRFPAKDQEVLVLHTLCVSPQKAGQGIGKKMVCFALERAKEMGCKVMRLDAFEGNQPAITMYEKMDFQYAGSADVIFQGLIPERQKFFEYLL